MILKESKIFDFFIGTVLFGIAMMYLYSQNQTVERFNEIAIDKVLEQKDLYQQMSDTDLNKITDTELKAIMIGYREYPIAIDGIVIPADDMDYEKNIPIVKDGFYIKSYQCNSNHDITQIIYTYASGM